MERIIVFGEMWSIEIYISLVLIIQKMLIPSRDITDAESQPEAGLLMLTLTSIYVIHRFLSDGLRARRSSTIAHCTLLDDHAVIRPRDCLSREVSTMP